MADDVPEEELGIDEAPRGRGSQTPIIILLVVVCLLMAANLFFTLKKTAAPPANGGVGVPPTPEEVFVFDMPEAVRKQTKDGIVLVRLQVEFRTDAARKLLETDDGQGKFDDVIMSTFLRKTAEDVDDVDQLRAEFKTQIEEMVGEEQVVRINFRDLIYQPLPDRSKGR